MVDIDVRDAIKTLNAQFGYLSNDKRNLAIARAINHTIGKSQTLIINRIKAIYDIPNKYIKQDLSIVKADRLTLRGLVKAKGRPLPLISFRARQVGRGVSVITPTGRKIIPGVFIASMPNGHTGVYVRGKYASGQIARRRARIRKSGPDLPITELKGISIPKAMANKIIIQNLSKSIADMFPPRLEHELQRIAMPV